MHTFPFPMVSSYESGGKVFDIGFLGGKVYCSSCFSLLRYCACPSSSVPQPLIQKPALMSLPVTGSVRGNFLLLSCTGSEYSEWHVILVGGNTLNFSAEVDILPIELQAVFIKSALFVFLSVHNLPNLPHSFVCVFSTN